jgi:AhpD family alkylhydroperoxidase
MLELDEMSPEVRSSIVSREKAGMVGVPRIEAHQPEMAAAQSALGAAIMRHGTLPRRLFELVRLRIAYRNQCRTCMSLRYQVALDDGLTENSVCELERPFKSKHFTPAEISALRFADLFATDHQQIDDAIYDDLKTYFTDAQIVELGYLCAISVGFGRLAATWDVVEALPDGFKGVRGTVFTPWDSDDVRAVGHSRRPVAPSPSP